MKKIGVLALQGAFKEHINMVELLGHEAIEIRKVEQLEDIDGIILPGGESTVIGKLLDDFGIKEALIDKIKCGLPVWGTCAGMILLANEIDNQEDVYLRVMNIKVKRNAYGSQLDSFIVKEVVKGVSEKEIPMVFIRAPYIVDMGDDVELLHRVDGNIVAVRQKNMLATSFHPELTDDTTFHEYFINMVNKKL
ncbi:pyridoxal 5'-phosphate synthase glutaminase subunit PdxT [Tepidibacter thalassicus]|uniref:Pyridoxal 5'-phosphate synthase subunit PdxT n=1 Tax=Tepidibacter thalassicus DSM 15285 TaxID=1123350 RepID=A0A1M5R861_9FIRM|nr:pyridoxal 5'-phosphate synthase glutaminase subunit PdxT [Tepidibacter thalassicus]SHH22482.1 5'-phosphate synthase pdxT subunit [Tepidibacter thalassicus DSM 15285]